MALNVEAVQASLTDDGLDGWLLYDFHGSNPIATTGAESLTSPSSSNQPTIESEAMWLPLVLFLGAASTNQLFFSSFRLRRDGMRMDSDSSERVLSAAKGWRAR